MAIAWRDCDQRTFVQAVVQLDATRTVVSPKKSKALLGVSSMESLSGIAPEGLFPTGQRHEEPQQLALRLFSIAGSRGEISRWLERSPSHQSALTAFASCLMAVPLRTPTDMFQHV